MGVNGITRKHLTEMTYQKKCKIQDKINQGNGKSNGDIEVLNPGLQRKVNKDATNGQRAGTRQSKVVKS